MFKDNLDATSTGTEVGVTIKVQRKIKFLIIFNKKMNPLPLLNLVNFKKGQ